MTRLKNNSPRMARFWSKVDKSGDCWLWTGAKSGGGYGYFVVSGRALRRAHRISWELHHGPIRGDLQCLHRCDVRACVNPEHLFLGNHADNMGDRNAKGRQSRHGTGGRKRDTNHASKLSTSDAALLCSVYAMGGYLQREIGPLFGITQSAVSRIVILNRKKESSTNE